jgi:hypothetical protein
MMFPPACGQTSSEAHPVSYQMGTRGKARPRRDADHSPHLAPRSRMSKTYYLSPSAPARRVAGQLYFTAMYLEKLSKTTDTSEHPTPVSISRTQSKNRICRIAKFGGHLKRTGGGRVSWADNGNPLTASGSCLYTMALQHSNISGDTCNCTSLWRRSVPQHNEWPVCYVLTTPSLTDGGKYSEKWQVCPLRA